MVRLATILTAGSFRSINPKDCKVSSNTEHKDGQRAVAVLPPAYLSKKLTAPIPAKDGGTLRTNWKCAEYHDRDRPGA